MGLDESSYSGVGANADVYLGATRSIVTGLAKSVSVISDSLWQARQTAYQGGAIKLLAQGTDADGHKFYLVTGEKSVIGSAIDNTFIYSQKYILESIPTLAQQRLNLLENFPDRETAQAVATQRGVPVYWYKGVQETIVAADTLRSTDYEMITPENTEQPFPDEVATINKRVMKWITIISNNEKEKVMARMSGQRLGTYSVSGNNTYTRNDNYAYGASYTVMPQEGLWLYNLSQTGTAVAERLTLDNLKNMKSFWESSGKAIGESVSKIIDENFTNYVKDLFSDDMIDQGLWKPEELEGKTSTRGSSQPQSGLYPLA